MENRKEEIRKIRKQIVEDLKFKEELDDEKMKELISGYLLQKEVTEKFSLTERKRIGKEIFDSLRKMDILQDLLEEEEITEIMVNGPENVFIEKEGRLQKIPLEFESKEALLRTIHQITAKCNRSVNESSPIVDARLATGERVNIVLYPIALNGPILTIRRFPRIPMSMEKLIRLGALDCKASVFLQTAVKAKYNILVSGGTGSGKTSLLNALSDFIPKEERIITIEDSAELQIQGIENLIRLETRTLDIAGGKNISIRDLIKTSLRMRPDRIIVGEVRGEEAIDMIGSAMNCGHDGSMSTIHANSAKDVLSRLENMYLMAVEIPVSAIRRQIASGVDLIVQLARLRDKSRKIIEITEITGIENGEIKLNPLYLFQETREGKRVEGELKQIGTLVHTHKMETAGVDQKIFGKNFPKKKDQE